MISQQKADRLAAALKQNLKRRKTQAQARKAAAVPARDEVEAKDPWIERDKPSD